MAKALLHRRAERYRENRINCRTIDNQRDVETLPFTDDCINIKFR